MRLRRNLPGLRAAGVALLLALSLLAARAVTPALVTVSDSVRPVATAPAGGAAQPHAFITRTALMSKETAAEMTFEVALKLRNVAEMKARVASGDPISPQELAAKFEPLPADYQAVAAWLTGQGLTVVYEDSHHLAIFARGTVSQIQAAMHVNFARVTSEGKEYTSAVTAPSVPASLSPLLVGINGLQPHLHAHKNSVHPNATVGSGSYTPAQIAQAYQATALYNAGITGAGQTIAIVIDAAPAASDLAAFWSTYGISQLQTNIATITIPSAYPTSPRDTVSGEETLDTEWSSAMAPGAKVRIYATQDLTPSNTDLAYAHILADTASYPIHQMSMSFGEGESNYESNQSQITTDDNYFMELTNAGVTCFASSGDEGATPGFDSQGNQTETGSVQAEFPASDPHVIGVGGTTLTSTSSPNASTETAWNSGGAASGGGASIFFSNTEAAWQTGTGVPAGTTHRLVPDISCAADPNYGADIYYTDPTDGLETVLGGTSWSSPTCAGFCALINQARAQASLLPVGALGPRIYPLIGTTSFRDIVSGSNITANSTNEYPATTGYDEVTGIGVPLLQPLVQALTGGQTLAAQPGDVTVNRGVSALFTVTATGTPASFQWQQMAIGSTTWSNLSSNSTYAIATTTTTSSLTVNNTTTAMSGDQFQCVVSYSGGVTLTTNPASGLTVENPWTIVTLAGKAGIAGTTNSATGTSAEFDYPTGIAIDGSGNLYIADLDNNVIREVSTSGAVSTPYGSGTVASTNGTGAGASFDAPRDIIANGSLLYVTDEGSGLIREINTSTRAVTTINTGTTTFSEPKGIGIDGSGHIYVADAGDNVIWKITLGQTSNTVTILAGSSSFDYGYQDNPIGADALFDEPLGLAVNKTTGDVYVTDYYNCVIRKITSAGAVTTVAGQPGLAGCLDGTTTQALFNVPRGITIDSSGNLFVADSIPPGITQSAPLFSGNNLLREISSGVVTTLAGQGEGAGSADGFGSSSQFYNICGLAMGSAGQLYIADASNNTIRTATLVIPTVSVSATQPNASIKGPVTGQFQVTRTGNTGVSLVVNYSVSGTAVSGTDYAALPGTVTIPAGASSAPITVAPYLDPQVTGSTLQLTLTGPVSSVSVNPAASSATVNIAELQPSDLVSFSAWQSNHPVTTPLSDGVAASLKYLFDIDPSVPMSTSDYAAMPSVGTTTAGQNEYLTLTYRRYLYATGITPHVQTSTDLLMWTAVNSPAISQQVGTDPGTGDPIWEVGVLIPADTTRLFIRLNVTQP